MKRPQVIPYTLNIVVDNMIRVSGAPVKLKAEITKRLTVDNPEYVKQKKRGFKCWGIDPKIRLYSEVNGQLVLPRGFYEELINLVIHWEYKVSWLVQDGTLQDFGAWNDKYAIREAQKPCLRSIRGKDGVLVAPAGSGKTIMGLRTIYDMDLPSLWITHTIDLLEQTTAKAYDCMPNIGKIGRIAEGACDWGDGKLIVATYQTLMNNDNLIRSLNTYIGIVVVDECHHVSSECFSEVVNKLTARYRLGLTATPDRKDGMEVMMYATIGPKLYQIDRNELYSQGRLIKPEIKFIYTDFDYDLASQVSESGAVDAGGEEIVYHELMQALINDEQRLQFVVSNILAQKGYQLIISDSIPYCHKIYDKLIESLGVVSSQIAVVHGTLQRTKRLTARGEADAMQQIQDGKAINAKYDAKAKRWKVQVVQYDDATYKRWNIPTAERKRIMQDAADRKIDILIATGQLVQEGVDLPHLNHGHLVTPKNGDKDGKSNGIPIEQGIGRIMRPDHLVPNKTAVWWDYVDYNVGIFNSQYSSRRKVYERLGLTVPVKPRSKREETASFLNSLKW